MSYIITTIYAIFLILIIIKTYKKNDLLNPAFVFSVMFFVKNVPSLFYYSSRVNILSISNMLVRQAAIQQGFIRYIVLTSIGILLFLLGLKAANIFVFSKSRKKKERIQRNKIKYNRFLWSSLIFLCVGLVAAGLLIQSVGGLRIFLNNLQYRTIILGNNDLLTWLKSFLFYFPSLYLYSKSKNKGYKVTLIFILITTLIGLIHGMGGRKSVILLFISLIFIYHYSIKKINLMNFLNIRYLPLVILGLFAFIIIPTLRTEGSFNLLLDNFTGYIQQNMGGVFSSLAQEGYARFHVLTLHYFENHSFWLGRSFFGLLYAIIPSTIFSSKPPVDDGMYLYSIAQGREDIMPLMAANNLNLSSYPLETFSSMYANFGFLGIVLGYFFLGFIIGKVYKFFISDNPSYAGIMIYMYVIINLELSTLRIFQVGINIFLILSIYFVTNNIVYSTKNNKNLVNKSF